MRIRLLILLFTLANTISAQQKMTPEMVKASSLAKEMKFDSALIIWEKIRHDAIKSNNQKVQVKATNAIAQLQYMLGEKDQSLKNAESALKMAKGSPSDEIESWLAIANVRFSNMEDEEAMKAYQQVEKIAQANGIENGDVSRALANIGTLFWRSAHSESLEMAEKYFKKGYDLAVRINDLDQKHIIGCQVAGALTERREYDQALKLYLDAYDHFRATNNLARIHFPLVGICNVHKSTGNFAEAERYHKAFIEIAQKTKNNTTIAFAYWSYGQFLHEIDDLQKAVDYYEKAIAVYKSEKNWQSGAIAALLGELTQIHAQANDYKNAYLTQKESLVIEDSINRRESERVVADLEKKYDSEKKSIEITALSAKNEKQKYLAIGGFALVAMGGFAAWYTFRNRIRTAQKLKEVNEMKSRFFANISHEFRTPLTMIKSPVQNLMASGMGPSQLEDINHIDRNADRMLELVNQLLELSKLDGGQMGLLLKKAEPDRLLKMIIEPFQSEAVARMIVFQSTVNTSGIRDIDSDVLQKIATNLLSNAFKYNAPDGIISFDAQFDERQLRMEISNTVVDMKVDDLTRIFERFYHKGENRNSSGIGLALVKELVELYQGSITSKLDGDRLTFTVSLPMPQTDFSAEIAAPSTTHEIPEGKPLLLVVDDNAEIRGAIKSVFVANYTVLEAADGFDAFEIAKREIPDAIVSDVMMPKMDGFEFASKIKEDELTSFIPVVMLTAKTSDDAHLEALKHSADAFLTKPFNHEILRSTVANLLAERKKLQERYSRELVLRPVDIAVNSADEKFIIKLQTVLDTHMTNPNFSAEDFADAVGMSRMQLHRKLKSLLGVTTTEFLRNERLNAAAALLQKGGLQVSDVAYSVGFNDLSYFSKCFKERFNATPTEYTKKS